MTSAARVRVEGTVQGVGFRPYVYRLANELALGGWGVDDEGGGLPRGEGGPGGGGERAAVERFCARLPSEAPPLARVERVAREEVAPSGIAGFTIARSPA